ncbi:hypothetical protein Tco_0376508, partial [Tanacetum coccineum]
AEFNIREKRRLSSFVEEKNSLLKARDKAIKSLKAQLLVKEAKLQDDMLADQLVKFQDKQMAIMHEKFNKLDADFIETCLHLEEILYPHMLTTIVGGRWLLTYGMKLAVFKCLNSPKYL